MEKREPSCTVGENVNLHSHYGEQYVYSLKNKDYDPGTPLPYDPAIPLLGIYLEENKIEKDTCISLSIVAVFAIARTWKQPRCPSTDE